MSNPHMTDRLVSPLPVRQGCYSAKRGWYFVICCAALFFLCQSSAPVRAGGLPEHYYLTFTMARAAGYSSEDANVIASAAWAIDMNRDTTVSEVGVKEFEDHLANNYLNFGREPEKFVADEIFADNGALKYVAQAVMCHGMGTAATQKAVGEFWRSQIEKPGGVGLPVNDRARLVLIGMYMHTLVDNKVHPPTPTLGHLVVMNEPDRAINRPKAFAAGAIEMFDYLRATNARYSQSDANQKEHFRKMGLWDEATSGPNRKKVEQFAERTVYAIGAAYQEKYGDKFSDWPYTSRPQDWTELDETDLKTKVHANLFRALHPDFNNAGGLGLVGDVKYTEFKYVRNTQHGALEIKSPDGQSMLATIEDPVHAVQAARPGIGLAGARGEMVADALHYTNNVAWLAVGTAVLPAVRISSALGKARDLTADESRQLLQRARAAAGNLASDTRVVYHWGQERGIEAVAQVAEEGPRLIEAGADGLKLYVGLATGEGKVYDIGREAMAQIASDAKVGGVNFDVAANVLRALATRDSSVEKQVILTDGQVVLVSLNNVFRAFEQSGRRWDRLPDYVREPGGIARVHGYLYLPEVDDVVLIGVRRPDRPKMQLEDLVVALASTWKRGETPKCSLDPEPGRPSGPQHVKVWGVPHDSRYAKVMLDADYAMKRIISGDLSSGAPGFHSLQDLFNVQPDSFLARPIASRYWFYPLQASKEQIPVSPSGDVGLFQTNLEVLTEVEMLSERGLAGVNPKSSIDEQVARSFTDNYDAIAQSHPIFDELRTVYDLTVIARLLRELRLQSRSLENLASAEYRKWTLPASYPGVTHVLGTTKQGDGITTTIAMTGGADLAQRMARRKFASRDDLQLIRLRSQALQLSRSEDIARDTGEASLVVTPMTFQMGLLEDRYRQALRAFQNGDIAQARDRYTDILKEEPDFIEALAYRAMCHVELGEPDLAEADINRALQQDSRDDFVQRIASYVQFRYLQKRLEDPRVRREFAEGFLKRAELKKNLDLDAAAQADLDMAIKVDPNYAEAYIERAFYRQIRNQFREALDDWDQVVANAPELYTGYAYRGLTKSNLDEPDLEGSINDCNRAIELSPDDYLAYFVRGKVKYDLEDQAEAIQDLDKAIARNPGFAPAYYVRARVKLQDPAGWAEDMTLYFSLQGKRSEAALVQAEGAIIVMMCDALLQRDPRSLNGLRLRGMALAQQGRPEPAERDFSEAINLQPGNVELYERRAEVRAALKQYQGAEADLTQMLTLDKQRTETLLSRASVRHDWAMMLPDDQLPRAQALVASALADLEELLKHRPSSYDAYLLRSNLHQSLGQTDAALADINECIRLQTSNAAVYVRRGMLFRQLQRFGLAAQDFERALRIDPSRARVLMPLIEDMKTRTK